MSREMNNGFDDWGGYMQAKVTKLEEQFSTASDPFRKTNLFEGISIYVNGLTNPSADELKRIMMVHGGIYHHYERSHTTYIIASNLPDVKVRNMNLSKYISPKWVVDCLSEQRILDYTKYLLYTNQKTSQPKLMFRTHKNETTENNVEQNQCEELNAFTTKKNVILGVDNMEAETVVLEQSNNEKCSKAEISMNTTAEKDSKAKKNVLQQSINAIKATVSTSVATSNSGSNTARTANDPKFLNEFYNNSRLHHIATLGAGFKDYVTELREIHGDAGFPHRELLKLKLLKQGVQTTAFNSINACVMHIDMDCFFVSVGLRQHPELRGQPVAVTHSKGGSAATDVQIQPGVNHELEMELFAQKFQHHLHNNIASDKVRNGFEAKLSLSEIASCSYEARAKGIRNGMFVGHALKLCPELKTIPYDFEGYREVAYTLYNTIAQYTLNIEAVSCDEMFVELSDVLKDIKVTPMDFVSAIREEVREKTYCPCSAGVGANKLQARMATKRAKPDGQFYLKNSDVDAYMAEIPIADLPGVGSSTEHTLKSANFLTCGDLQRVSLNKIQMYVGKKLGETLHQFCRGIDNRPLQYVQIRKSVSAEVNYGIRFSDGEQLEAFMHQLCEEVHSRLLKIKRKSKSVTLKLMVRAKDAPVVTSKFMGHGVCDNVNKTTILPDFTNDLDVITKSVLSMLSNAAVPPNELRGIGIQLTKLDEPTELLEQKKENVIKNMFEKVAERRNEKQVEPIELKKSLASESTKANIIKVKMNSNSMITEKATSPKRLKKETRARPASKRQKNQPDVLGMFQNAVNKKLAEKPNENITTEVVHDLPSDIDPEVFAELPPDIRAEILAERGLMPENYQINEQHNNQENVLNDDDLLPSTSRAALARRQADSKQQSIVTTFEIEYMEKLPDEILSDTEERSAFQVSAPPPPPSPVGSPISIPDERLSIVSLENMFKRDSDTCINLLLDWVLSQEDPEEIDIVLFVEQAITMVKEGNFAALYEPLTYLCRLLNSMKPTNCKWHVAYKKIILSIQNEMFQMYEKELYLSDKIECDNCIISNDL